MPEHVIKNNVLHFCLLIMIDFKPILDSDPHPTFENQHKTQQSFSFFYPCY